MMVYGSYLTIYHWKLIISLTDPGHRYAKMAIGQPPQTIEMDLNMLASDFYVVITTSRKGSRYDDLFSQTGGNFENRKLGVITNTCTCS